MTKREITVRLDGGLETRPVALLVQMASQFQSEVYVESENRRVNAKSIMRIADIDSKKELKFLLSVIFRFNSRLVYCRLISRHIIQEVFVQLVVSGRPQKFQQITSLQSLTLCFYSLTQKTHNGFGRLYFDKSVSSFAVLAA